ncbi:hypothetical protein DRH14_05685 [Candidatus Shapirobacteria bacterium]|nr:MAG: hypothetical protein DRH14_05685 [Candidatus Shapirobacteria bacterium]
MFAFLSTPKYPLDKSIVLLYILNMQKNKLKEIRCKRKLTLKDLSQKTNLSTSYLSRIENNERVPRVYNAIRIAHALNVGVEDIFFIDDKQEKKKFLKRIKSFFSKQEV